MFPSNINLNTLNGLNGFSLTGSNTYDRSDHSVSDIGDFNGDGVADVLVGAYRYPNSTY